MIPALLVAVFACVAVAYVTAPLKLGPRRDLPTRTSLLDDATERKRAALAAIIDLEAERDMGKLSDAEFGSLRDEYEAQALVALREMDAIAASERPDDELEAEIAEVRARLACPICGAPRSPGTRCGRCGAS